VEEVYLARVFHRESMPGNLTGVVVCPSPPRPRDCQFVARRLGLPDTCFVWKSASGNWMHRTFSPYEELTFCTQTLLAGAACLQAGKDCPFETAIGPVTVHRDEGQYWIRQDVDKARRLKDRSVLHRLGLEEQLLGGEPAVTGVGRQRLYIPLRSPGILYRLTFSSEIILRECRRHGWTVFAFLP